MDRLDEAAQGLPIYFTAPAQLHRIDLSEKPEQRYLRTYEGAKQLLGEVDDADCHHIATLQELMLGRLIDAGVVYCAQAFAHSEVDTHKLCTAQFTIIVRELSLPHGQSLSLLANGLRDPGDPREVATVQYPAGEAVVIGEELEVKPSITASGQPNTKSYRMRQAQIIMPLPARQRVAIIGTSSTDLEDWEHFVRMLNEIAHSVSFRKKDANNVSARLDALD